MGWGNERGCRSGIDWLLHKARLDSMCLILHKVIPVLSPNPQAFRLGVYAQKSSSCR
jgi:hypothetical protein